MSTLNESCTAIPHIRSNLQAFRDTFRKSSRIYRFLSESWKTNPLYLSRTLSYINKHHVKHLRRRDTKIDSVARRLMNNHNDDGHRPKKLQPQRISKRANQPNITCIYNWICNDKAKTNQKTKSCGFSCPWCERDYGFLDSLFMHLKCTHPRFNFNLVEDDGHPVIEITLNLSFDGSYCGFKYPGHDLRRDFRFTPSSPERRTSTTQLIHFKSRRRQLSSALEYPNLHDGEVLAIDEDEADVDVCSGRLYYHTSTCLPVKPNEGDIDSEADIDPEWLRERTQLMIDEFTDVNEGEKEILKIWNLHIMKNYKYKGDNMMRQACMDLVEMEGHTILSRNLFKNFTLHLANLYDFGLIGSKDVLECIRKLRLQLCSTH